MVCKTEMKRAISIILGVGFVALLAGYLSACVAPEPAKAPTPAKIEEPAQRGCCPRVWPGTVDGELHATKLTAYYPDSSALEGGFEDRKGYPLKTLQAFLAGKANAVTVAMDYTIAPYGTKLCIPELNEAYGKAIAFELKDTGGAFMPNPKKGIKGKGWTRADICVGSYKESVKSAVNQTVDLIECVGAR